MLQLVLTTYGAVFVAEIVGDKLLYTTGVLAARYRSASVVLGMALAFMCKMAVAVAIGAAISQLPRWLVAAFTAASFIGVALTVWGKPDVRQPKAKDNTASGLGVQDASLRAGMAQVVSMNKRGTAFGTFNGVYGVAWFAGSSIMGVLYGFSITALVAFGVITQLVAAGMFFALRRPLAEAIAEV